jgi:hypothetical protein
MSSTSLWIAQVFVAAVMVVAGAMKLLRSREQLARRFHWATSWEPWQIKMLGLVELTAAVGLVVPTVTGTATFLTPIVAANVFLLMASAARTHQKLRESVVFPAFLAALSLFIAAGRIAEHVNCT